MDMLKEWIESYNPKTKTDLFNAKREIVQEIVLAGLYRGGFFKGAAFYGGTALRILYGLDRYSEDLDFCLLEKNPKYTMEPYFNVLKEEFSILGLDIDLSIKNKQETTSIESAFLKDNSQWAYVSIEDKKENRLFPTLKIKLEVDRVPPLGFETEQKLLLRPYSFYVNCMKKEFLFAGKMHAVLFRKWGKNVKGRDWYDLQWYISRGVNLDIDHFKIRTVESGHWEKEKTLTRDDIKNMLDQKIKSIDINMLKNDILRFIPDESKIELWSREYFLKLMEQIDFTKDYSIPK